MAKKSKLLQALDAHKNRDYDAEKRKKQVKAAEKRKQEKAARRATEAESDHDGGSENGEEETITLQDVTTRPKKSASTSARKRHTGSELDFKVKPQDAAKTDGDGNELEETSQSADSFDDSASKSGEESDIPLSELEAEDREDVIPHQRMAINNGPALIASRKRVTIVKPSIPFHHHNSLISSLPTASEAIPDAMDDLTREAEFYRIARDAVTTARSMFRREKIPFTRPSDFFAEMVKTDEHMGKIKKKLYDEAADKKAREEARKQRDARKFGKQVQIAKEQERAREKRETLDKIKELKRKRKGVPSADTTENPDDLFQEITVDHSKPASSSKRDRSDRSSNDRSSKRQRRDAKFGFGGKKRFSKSGDALSSADMSGFSAKGMKARPRQAGSGPGSRAKKGPTKRLGKSRRVAGGGGGGGGQS